MNQGATRKFVFEYPLFSDSRFTGDRLRFGPAEIVNASEDRPGLISATLFLRIEDSIEPPPPQLERYKVSRSGSYHGGDMKDEVAALLSLALGVRLKAGGTSRSWDFFHKDPYGKPMAGGWQIPRLERRWSSLMIPWAISHRSIEPLGRPLTGLPLEEANALIRSARLFQEAMWLAESEPHLAWLMLISAVECAAAPNRKRWANGQHFVEFLQTHKPDAPEKRPHSNVQVAWEESQSLFKKVWEVRNKAVHEGEPFPLCVCQPPMQHEEWAAPEELPKAGGYWPGPVWAQDDLPMHLHVFAHAVRGAILNWWRSL